MAERSDDRAADSDSVEVGAGSSEELPGSSGAPGRGTDNAGNDGQNPTDSVPAGVCPNWEYELVDSESGYYRGAFAGERPSAEHQLLGRSCTTPGMGTRVVGAEWVLVGEDGVPAVDPAVLAQQAVDSLRLPTPVIAASPADMQLVRLPVWLWLEGSSWESQSASASVPGLTVTAVAEPTQVSWSMGDGSTVVCDGPGTTRTRGMDPKASSPDCGHTYTQPSSNRLRVTATVSWRVTWSGGGASGSIPGMTTTAAVSWSVTESHALVTG
jgi:hypothetical protein